MTGQGTDSVAGWLTNGELIPDAKREELRPIAANAYAIYGDSTTTRDIIAALCQPVSNSRHDHHTVTPERSAWLARCRAWLTAQGHNPRGRLIPLKTQQAYTDATGDVYQGPKTARTGQISPRTRSQAQNERRAAERDAGAFNQAQAARRATQALDAC